MSQRPSSSTTPQSLSPDDRGVESTGKITVSNTGSPMMSSRTSFDGQHLQLTNGASLVQRRSSTGDAEDNRGWHGTPIFVLDSSPLHRAGPNEHKLKKPYNRLLQARLYNPTIGFGSFQDSLPTSALPRMHPVPHSQDTIRLNTMQLSNMSFSSSTVSPINVALNETDDTGFIFPTVIDSSSSSPSPDSPAPSDAVEDMSLSQSTLASAEYPNSIPSRISSSTTSSPYSPQTPTRTPPRSGASTPRTFQPSGLTLLRQEW